MSLHKNAAALVLIALTAIAAPAAAQTTAPAPAAAQTARVPARRARATLGLRAGRTTAWVGEAIPVTITAVFRDVEGVTLEGGPTLTSKAIVTSEIAKEPVQSTEIVGGERVLVVRWTATVTPSTSGPLDLAVGLPVRLRYHDAATRVARPAPPADPFADLGDLDAFGGGSDVFSAMVDRMRAQMMQATEDFAVGAAHEEAIELSAATPSLDVRALPAANQPATFSGAVGSFAIEAALSTAKAAVSAPVTLRITVSGDVDPDRVDLPGVASSATWKAYPPRVVPSGAGSATAATTGMPRPATSRKKVFEQVLVPLRGGDATVPAIAFTAFDPKTGSYVTHQTAPLAIFVDGNASPAAPDVAPTSLPSAASAVAPVTRPIARATIVHAAEVAGGVALLLVLVAAAARALRRRRGAWTLRRSMRRAAAAGDVEPFLGAAHRLIAARLATKWGLDPTDVTAASIRARLGDDGAPLADVLVADAALRFGRGGIDAAGLGVLCRSVERSLRAAPRATMR